MHTMTETKNGAFARLAGAMDAAAAFLASIPAAARAARRAGEVEHLLRLDDAALARLGRTRTGVIDWVFEGVAR